ncbi:MAG: polysaccharide deacetylase family protein [Elainellaceae cyanobacterium]
MRFASLYPWLYWALNPMFPDCLWAGSDALPKIALTFDDGPHSDYTPQVLNSLDQYQIKASFFWLGCCVERSPSIARDVYQRGHWVGLHGYHHRSFPRLPSDELKRSLLTTQKAIAEACQLTPEYVEAKVCDVRPPNGLFTPKILRQLHQWGYRSVMWSVVPEDWVRPGIAIAAKRIEQQTRNGSLIVLHDGYHGGVDAAATVREIVPTLLNRGYQFVTIDQLWQQHPLRQIDRCDLV